MLLYLAGLIVHSCRYGLCFCWGFVLRSRWNCGIIASIWWLWSYFGDLVVNQSVLSVVDHWNQFAFEFINWFHCIWALYRGKIWCQIDIVSLGLSRLLFHLSLSISLFWLPWYLSGNLYVFGDSIWRLLNRFMESSFCAFYNVICQIWNWQWWMQEQCACGSNWHA